MRTKKLISLLLVFALLLSTASCSFGKKDEEPDDSVPVDAVEEPIEEDVSFVFTGDLDNFRQTHMDSIIRSVSSADVVRDKKYELDSAKAETIINTIDKALGSTELKSLLNLDLKTTLLGVLDNLYTNDLVNTIIQYLYPLVGGEFAKVWAGLPSDLALDDVATGVPVVSTAQVNADLYIDQIEEALETIKFYLFPTTFAAHLPPEYSAIAAKLSKVTTRCIWDKETETLIDPWKDPSILTEDGKLDLDWGVTDKASFINAVSAALYGVEPLLLALIANKPLENSGIIGRGEGEARILAGKIALPMTIDTIELVLRATPNKGYDNALIPIFEALGVTVSSADNYSTMREVVELGLLEPIEALLAALADAPLNYVLAVLPNLAYAVTAQMIVPLLGMLKTEISYTTNAVYTVKIAGEGKMNDAYKSDEPIKINLGEMINLEDMGLDISSFDAILSLVSPALGVTLPHLDGAKLATLGNLIWKNTNRSEKTYSVGSSDKAAYIVADKGDVLLFLFDYLFDALQDSALRSKVLGLLGNNLPDIGNTIVRRVLANPRNAIAAVAELIIPQSYSKPKGMQWSQPQGGASNVSSLYTAYWTREKADYMVSSLPGFVDGLLGMIGPEIGGQKASSLSDLIGNLVGSLLTANTVNSLAETVQNLLSGVSLPAAVTDLLKSQLGVDLNAIKSFRASFADGDKDAFKAAISDFLSPLNKVLAFLLTGEDLSISLTDGSDGSAAKLITLSGNDGYTTAIIPLLEALGVPDVMSPAAFKADSGKILSNLLTMIFGFVDAVQANPLGKIVEILPNLLLFLHSGGVTTVVENLLYPVNLLLDIIRPIYSVNISDLVGMDITFRNVDLIAFAMGYLNPMITNALGINLNLNFTTDSLYNALFGDITPERYTSANGQAAYRINPNDINKADLLTIIYDYLLKTILSPEVMPALLNMLKNNLGLDGKVYNLIEKILPAVQQADQKYPGAAKALVFWIIFVAEPLLGIIGTFSGGISGLSDITGAITSIAGSVSLDSVRFSVSELAKDARNEGFFDMLRSIISPVISTLINR